MGHPSIPCGCGSTAHPPTLPVSPFSAFPSPLAFPPAPPRCPATTRHQRRYGVEMTGLQCHYEPGHDGDHAAYAGPGEGDVFWPQEAPAAEARDGSGSGGISWFPPPGTTVTVT